MNESILMAKNSSIHKEWIEEILSNIKTFIFCPILGDGALISDRGTYAVKRDIGVLGYISSHLFPVFSTSCGTWFQVP